jgi:hypothetical protein
MKDFLKNKGIGFWFVAAAMVLTLIAFIAYIVNGSAIRNVNGGVIFFFIVAFLAEGVTLWKEFYGIAAWIAAIFTGIALGYYLSFSADYIGYLFTGVMGYAGTMGSFLTFAICSVLAIIAAIVANFVQIEKEE